MEQHIHISYQIIKENELSKTELDLFEAAKNAAENAYAPHSKFRVGAAILDEEGSIHIGSNQENAAYPSGLCAERVALFHFHASHPKRKIKALAIYTPDLERWNAEITAPCGGCRQVIAEYEHLQKQPYKLLLAGKNSLIYSFNSASDLLPLPFH